MTDREEALRLAKEAGFEFGPLYTPMDTQFSTELFVNFYRLARTQPQQEPVAEVVSESAIPQGTHLVRPIGASDSRRVLDIGMRLYASLPAQAVPEGRQPIPVKEIIHALERESANTDTDSRWLAATQLRHMTGWETRTLMCRIDKHPSETLSAASTPGGK